MGFIIMLARASDRVCCCNTISMLLVMWIDARLLWWYDDDDRAGNDVENQHTNKYLYCFDIFNVILWFGYNIIDASSAAASWVIEMYIYALFRVRANDIGTIILYTFSCYAIAPICFSTIFTHLIVTTHKNVVY